MLGLIIIVKIGQHSCLFEYIKNWNWVINRKTLYDMNNARYYARVSTDKDDQLNSLENSI